MQRFEHDMVSVRQGRHGAWLIDTLGTANGQFTTDSPQRNATVITPPSPSVSESVLRMSLGVTIFCILALLRVPLGITAKEAKVVQSAHDLGVVLDTASCRCLITLLPSVELVFISSD